MKGRHDFKQDFNNNHVHSHPKVYEKEKNVNKK